MAVKITVTAKYEVIFSDEDIHDFTWGEDSFENCYVKNFENWRLEPHFEFQTIKEERN